jgi:hypothetical protein
MEPRVKSIFPPCAEISLQIGQAIMAIEIAQRLPPDVQASVMPALERHLESLENQYGQDCLGKKGK